MTAEIVLRSCQGAIRSRHGYAGSRRAATGRVCGVVAAQGAALAIALHDDDHGQLHAPVATTVPATWRRC
jgi:hypothetical protein